MLHTFHPDTPHYSMRGSAKPRARIPSHAFPHPSVKALQCLGWCALGIMALWVFGGVELRLLLGADARWSARIQPIAWVLHFHATCGVMALVSGALQFVTRVRSLFPHIHRALGTCYVTAVIAASLTAMWVAASLGNPAVQLAASTQASLWIVSTLAGLLAIIKRDVAKHRWWMTRSFALTYTFVLGRFVTDVLHLRLPDAAGGEAAWFWLLTIAALVAPDLVRIAWNPQNGHDTPAPNATDQPASIGPERKLV